MNIIELAKEAGIETEWSFDFKIRLERFASLVRAKNAKEDLKMLENLRKETIAQCEAGMIEAYQLGRAEALEEAAKWCDDYINRLHDMRDNDMSLPQYQPELAGRQAGAGRCAAAIRGLK